VDRNIMPTTYLLVAILLCIGLHFLIPIGQLIPSPWNFVGIIPIIFGIWINLSADRGLKVAQTTVKPFEESNRLLQNGAYGISRNPMYLGFESILIGITFLLGTISPLLVVLTFPYLINRFFIRIEEQMLETKFSDEWGQYKSRVRKWL
jgi:protein-S-isoprenylcysteine O-methyltransferase Ste14